MGSEGLAIVPGGKGSLREGEKEEEGERVNHKAICREIISQIENHGFSKFNGVGEKTGVAWKRLVRERKK